MTPIESRALELAEKVSWEIGAYEMELHQVSAAAIREASERTEEAAARASMQE